MFVSPGGPCAAREGIRASGDATSGHEESRVKTKKRCLQRLGACFVELGPCMAIFARPRQYELLERQTVTWAHTDVGGREEGGPRLETPDFIPCRRCSNMERGESDHPCSRGD